MNNIARVFVALAAVQVMTMACVAVAQETEYGMVEEKIRTLVPNAKTIAVSETPLEGILQIQINSDIVYMTADSKYLFQGQILEMDTRINLTDQAKSTIRLGLLKELNTDEQISFGPENPVYDLLVFTDLDCGYCRKLHNQMEEYNKEGIAIHYLAFPRAGIGSASYDKFVSVWCADDQQQALTLAKNGDEPEPLNCPNPVADQYELGREVGVTGTPALVTENGTLIPGYMPPEQLRKRLDSLAGVTAAP